MRTRSRKRSSCASGSGNVPSSSIGFCVASTRNGRGSAHRHAVDGDLLLLHRLEQRALRARRRAVDLVGEDDVRDERAGAELELARLLVVEVDASDVGRHQVRRELDAPERAADAARERLREHRLAEPGHVFDQHVPVAEHRDERELDDVVAADDDARRRSRARGPPHLVWLRRLSRDRALAVLTWTILWLSARRTGRFNRCFSACGQDSIRRSPNAYQAYSPSDDSGARP